MPTEFFRIRLLGWGRAWDKVQRMESTGQQLLTIYFKLAKAERGLCLCLWEPDHAGLLAQPV